MNRRLVVALVFVAGCSRTAECEELGQDCAAEGTEDPTGVADDIPLPLRTGKDIDILFVIDNSGSMAEEQALLAANVGAFINVLEEDDVDANYRIGITTTDNGNPWCAAGTTTPEGGNLVLSSCKTRLDDFLFIDVDAQDLACNNICNLDEAALQILPTTTDLDPDPKPRPWLENIEGKKNIPETTDTDDAFACFLPQGINGCGFEAPLHSMYNALVRAESATEPNYGFVREDAILAIVFLTDEEDCSYDEDWAEIFDPAGSKVFWSDPGEPTPTSALCWNAGVECYGDPSAYDTCDPVNKDVSGNVTDIPFEAVLYPVDTYIEELQAIEDEKQMYDPYLEVIVALIGGVNSEGQPFYADVTDADPQFQDDFGIGPGCTAPNPLDPNVPITAVPPVRARVVTEEFGDGNMFSICEQDYSPALEAIAERIRDQIQPACYWQCVLDTNMGTEIIEPQCVVNQYIPGEGESEIVECLRDGDGYVLDPMSDDYAMPSDDVNVCYAMRVDKSGLSADPLDDMSPECVEANFNLEFVLERRPGFPAPGGTSVAAECEMADFPEVTCPGIGG
jgi:hypothetical protein